MAQVEAKLKAIEGLCTLLQLSLITAHEQAQGVRSPEQRQKLERLHDRLAVNTRGGQDIIVDGIVAGIGIQPNVELAQTAGLEVGNGIVVDETLRTSHPDIYAAGDVAAFYNPALGERLR